jgi:hypothetical protein
MDGEPHQGHLTSSSPAPAAGQSVQKPVLTFDQIQNVQQLKAGRCVLRLITLRRQSGCACSSREPAIHL